MTDAGSSREDAPLLRRPVSRDASVSSSLKSSSTLPDTESNGKDGNAVTLSWLRGSLIASSIGLLIFLQATNISILTTTQSTIAADLDAFEEVTWLTSSYLIAMSSLAPLMGRLSQVFSARMCLFACTILICIGSVVTSTSSTFAMFMVGRVITGSGAAGVLVVAAILVIQMASPKQRGVYLGLVNSGMTVGVSLGAVIAGALEPIIGWKPIFGMQAPLAILAGIGLLLGIPANYGTNNEYTTHSLREKLARIDYSGCVLLIATIVLFLLGLSGPRVLPTPLVLSFVCLPLFVLNETRIAYDPVIPMTVLRSRGTLLTCFATVGFMMARWCVLFYAPVYSLAVRGWPPAAAGSILIPTNAGFASGGILAGYFHIRRHGSFYAHSLISMALFPITLLILAFISTARTPSWVYITAVFFNGLLTGAALNYVLVHSLHLTLPDVHPIVLSLVATFRGFAGSFGSAIGGGLFARVLHKSLVTGFEDAGLGDNRDLIRQLLGSPRDVYRLEGEKKAIAISSYEDALKALFLAGMGLSILVVAIQAGTGWKEPSKSSHERIAEDEVEGEESLVAGS